MNSKTLIIRRAEIGDIEDIWSLLHAESKGWDVEQINGNLKNLLVLVQPPKLLGILFGQLLPGKEEVKWVVIHPFYPEKPLREVLIQSLIGTQNIIGGNKEIIVKPISLTSL